MKTPIIRGQQVLVSREDISIFKVWPSGYAQKLVFYIQFCANMSQNFEFVAHKNIIYGVADKESLIFCTGLRLNLEKLMVNLFEKYILGKDLAKGVHWMNENVGKHKKSILALFFSVKKLINWAIL